MNSTSDWGWGLLVYASGPLFETNEVSFLVDHSMGQSKERVQERGERGEEIALRNGIDAMAPAGRDVTSDVAAVACTAAVGGDLTESVTAAVSYQSTIATITTRTTTANRPLSHGHHINRHTTDKGRSRCKYG